MSKSRSYSLRDNQHTDNYYCTETVVLSVLSDVHAADEGKVTCLVLLNLSATFNTVDHDVLLDVLCHMFLGVRTCARVVPLLPA